MAQTEVSVAAGGRKVSKAPGGRASVSMAWEYHKHQWLKRPMFGPLV